MSSMPRRFREGQLATRLGGQKAQGE